MHLAGKVIGAWIGGCCVAACAAASTFTSAEKSGDAIIVTGGSGAVTYKAIVDPKKGGDITQVSIPADGNVIARELTDLFFLGSHGDQYTLRGWTGPEKFTISCSAEILSRKPDEVVVRVKLLNTGTVKVLVTDEPAKSNLRKAHPSYKDKAIEVTRLYTFKPDRIEVSDELLWLHADTHMQTFYCTSAFTQGAVQGPVRLVNGATTAGFNVTGSGGYKLPAGIACPFTAENFLKSGYKVSVRTAATSFDAGKSNFYYFEKAWQQDWFQLSGFMYKVADAPSGKPITATHEIIFAKAAPAEMPPVVTIQSPPWSARWMDEKGEVAPHKIGDTLKLSASATNSDGTPVPDQDITWDIHIDPWWNTPSATLHGSHPSYTIRQVANEVDMEKSKDRNLLAVITVKVRGRNGTEAVEPFAMLVGRAGQ